MDRYRRCLTYRDAGVDIDRQDEALERIKPLVKSTRTSGVLAGLGLDDRVDELGATVAPAEMERTFNMGLGMVVVAEPNEVPSIEAHLDGRGEGHFSGSGGSFRERVR